MKKYDLIINNIASGRDIKHKFLYLEGCFISFWQKDNKIYIKIKELLFRSLAILVINTKTNIYFVFKRNEKCRAYVIGSLNYHLKGEFYGDRYYFSNDSLRLKLEYLNKIQDFNDLVLSQIKIKGNGYFEKINSKISFISENSLLIERNYDWKAILFAL